MVQSSSQVEFRHIGADTDDTDLLLRSRAPTLSISHASAGVCARDLVMVNSKRLNAPAQDRRALQRNMHQTLEHVRIAGQVLDHVFLQGVQDDGLSSSDSDDIMLPPYVDSTDSDSGDDLIEVAVQVVAEKAAAAGAALASMSSYLESCEPQSQAANIVTDTQFTSEAVQHNFRDVFRWHCAEDVETVARALRMPDHFVLPNRGKVLGTTALLTTLARLAHSGPLASVQNYVPVVPSRISFTVTAVLEYLINTYWTKLFNGCMSLSARFPLYYTAISKKTGVPGLPCIGFIDGTGRETARCGNAALQNANYNGYYGGDVLKWHGVQVQSRHSLDRLISVCIYREQPPPLCRGTYGCFQLFLIQHYVNLATCRRRMGCGCMHGDLSRAVPTTLT